MATNNVLGKIYETLLCSPGMNEQVKIDIKVDRKTILLLGNVIENGLANMEGEDSIIKLLPKESIDELHNFSNECLKKAGLEELNQKIKTLNQK